MPDPGAPRAAHPPFIGRYRILGILGQGGMGTVYEAEQDQPRRIVALKVIRAEYASPSLLKRFEQEAELLGHLQHPGIAQIFDAGTEDTGRGPQPWFAMELIRGRTLLEHAASKQLSTDQKLSLFIRVCDAVQHAHAKGIIHRDLKPGNILVDGSGQPKILDFGVARATDSDVKLTTVETNLGQLIGTLPYMSPEQVAADPELLDTRSDIYALGVILYELLSGQRPYVLSERMLHEAVRVIREDDPKPLSTLNRVFRGDVETIVGKALEKERDRRYQSAAAMASDLQRHLDNEPISARPPSTLYQLGKFARRNRALVVGVAAVFVALVLGVVVSTWQAVRATRAEKQAKSESAKAIAVNAFLQEMLGSARPEQSLGRDLSVREMLDESAKTITSGSLKDQPEIEAAVRSTIGRAYESLGHYEVAKEHLARSLAFLRADPSTDPGTILDTLADLADAEFRLQERKDAEAHYREALEIARRSFGDGSDRAANCWTQLGVFLDTEHRNEEAEHAYREALAILRKGASTNADLVATTLSALGSFLQARNDNEEAEALLRESLELRRKEHGANHPEVSTSLWHLGDLEASRGDFDGAARDLGDALAMRRRILGPDHPHVALVLVSLAELEMKRKNLDAAKPLLDEALAIRTKAFGAEHVSVAATLGNLVEWHAARGDLASAVKVGHQEIALWKKLRGPDDAEVGIAENAVARWAQRAGDLAGAEALFRDALRIDRKVFGDDSTNVALVLANLAGVLYTKGDVAGAGAPARESLAIYRKALPAGHLNLVFPLRQLAFLLQKQGAWDEALRLEREAYEIDRKNRPEGSVDNASNLLSIATILLALEKWPEAETAIRESLALREKVFPPDDWRLANARSMLGEALAGQGKDGEAEPMLVASLEALRGNAKTPSENKGLARDRLVRFYGARGRAEDAKRWSAD